MGSLSSLQEAKVERLNLNFEQAGAPFLLEHALMYEFSGRMALVSSFGVEAAILLHMVSQIDPQTPVIFIDTGKMFTLTLSYRDQLVDRFGLKNLQVFHPDPKRLKQCDPDGDLWASDVDACCEIRKVEPLARALQGVKCWITGRKRYHGGSRGMLPKFELVDGVIKINPLADWQPARISHYFAKYDIPPHPLVARGFLSVGCHHCSAPSSNPDDVRSGRWAGSDKNECGLHTANLSKAASQIQNN